MKKKQYICIDLKSFYASVECVERGLDPMTTNLVVADLSRTEKTICLAVTPALKNYGIPGRARLFEVVQKVKEVNLKRKTLAPGRILSGESCNSIELDKDPSLAVSYMVAAPRMAHYMTYSTRIYQIYLRHVAPEDIHVYSIDEVFMDVTNYLATYKISAREFSMRILRDVLKETGITATVGIGTNLYLSKIAMDIVAKHMPADCDGVRIAELDEFSYRRLLWHHRPLTDFWRVGKGYTKKLEASGLFTMGDIARCSRTENGEKLLYKLFGVNAELLIDHAWGYEPCTISDIKSYRPESSSLGSGQVLQMPYDFEKAKLVVREMTELLVLELIEKRLVTDQMVLTVGYDIENLKNPEILKAYQDELTEDPYGRKIPKHAHGTANLGRQTSSFILIIKEVMALFDRIVDPRLTVRRLNITANRVVDEAQVKSGPIAEQIDLFTDYEAIEQGKTEEAIKLEKERKIQETVILLKKKYGKNAIIKGHNLQEGATAMDRNRQIGGHKA